jgi:DNA-binding CsgD family transcriptional regulator
MIYGLYCATTERIKIGATRHLTRLADLQRTCSTKLQLRMLIPGYLVEEAYWHVHFREIRLHGEWFQATPELLAIVDKQRRDNNFLRGIELLRNARQPVTVARHVAKNPRTVTARPRTELVKAERAKRILMMRAGGATQEEVARAFDCSVETIRRTERWAERRAA